MQISEEEIKRNCSAAIYRRGLEYFREGRVHLRLREEDAIGAIVDGEELYNVRITFSDEHIHDMLCTCPYYQTMGVACKHIVAALKMRQAELREQTSSGAQNENDRLASALCTEYEREKMQESCRLGLSLRIAQNADGNCTYAAVLRMGRQYPEPIKGVESFLEAYIRKKEFKVSRHKVVYPHLFRFPAAERAVLDILAESYENKSAQTAYYTPKLSETTFGAYTAARLFPLLKDIDCDITIHGMQISGGLILEEDPDILVDVAVTDENISLTVTESGLALTPDGAWFFYEGRIFHTGEAWRSWFMPIYRTVLAQERTRLDFSGNHRMEFAEKILPSLKNRRGVILQGIEEVIVDENPVFRVYLDCRERGITAAVIAHYGGISLRLPYTKPYSGKILLRQTERENAILEYFCDFSVEEGLFCMEEDEAIFRFLREALPKLREEAEMVESYAFSEMSRGKMPKLSASVRYEEKIDLLQVDFETELEPEELYALLRALREECRFYRLRDGCFLELSELPPETAVLSRLGLSEEECKKGGKSVQKSDFLYLAALTEQGLLTAEEGFLRLEKKIRSIRAEIPKNLAGVLRGYQKDGVHWMTQLEALGMGGILADDMGLGKTLQVIAYALSRNKKNPTLVIAPSALTYNWLSEIERFAPEARAVIVDGTPEEREARLADLDGYDFVITSYALLRRDLAAYRNKRFSACFLDEAQYIKNPRTMNACAVKEIRAEVRFALTGTPIENHVLELWSIFDFVLPEYLGGQKDFCDRYVHPMRQGDAQVGEDLQKRVHPFILRRMKKEVLSELPEKIENRVFAAMEEEQQKLYSAYLTAARREMAAMFAAGDENTMQILSLLLRLRQICCHPKLVDDGYQGGSGKLELLEELVSSAKESGHRVLVFSQFTSMLALIEERFRRAGILCLYLDGATPPARRVELAERFNAGEGDVFLISLKAGGTGLNLTGADMVIHYDPWWNPAVMDQASDRAYRIGQMRAVQVIQLAAKGTIEEQILKLSERKRSLADRIIRENKNPLSALSKEELKQLFE